ncbi:MAG: hypothetical protein IPL22_04490 [Bacteroidetes bacterium]|nr:hypothetical protein [Bacteroidota bacterium]
MSAWKPARVVIRIFMKHLSRPAWVKSFDHASLTKSSGNYDNHQPVYDKFHDFYYYPFWEKDSLRIMEFRLEGRDTIHKRTETASYIVGSGQHTNSHISNTDGFLHQMPLTFTRKKANGIYLPVLKMVATPGSTASLDSSV